jgi:hypothetical protein
VHKNIRIGFNGYWLQQTTGHRINNMAVPDSKERTVGLGPGVKFGGLGIWLHLNAYLDTDVRNRPSGTKVDPAYFQSSARENVKIIIANSERAEMDQNVNRVVL